MSTVAEKPRLTEIITDCFGDRAALYIETLRALTEAGIEFILINLPVHFDTDRQPTDLDLIQDGNGYAAACRFLGDRGFLRLDRQPGSDQVVFVGFDGRDRFIRIHLHQDLAFYGVTWFSFRQAREFALESGGWLYADPALDYHVIHLEWFFKNKPDYPRRIEQVRDRCDPSHLAAAGEKLFGDRLAFVGQVERLIRSGRRPSVRRRLAAVVRYCGLTSATAGYLTRKLLSRLNWWPIWQRRGLLLFLMGIDGSGKTSLAQAVSRQHDAGGLFCRYRYLGLKETLVQRLRQMGKRSEPKAQEKAPTGIADRLAESSVLLANLFNLLLSLLYISEYAVKCLGLLRPLRKCNDLVVVDRTYLDKLCDIECWGNSLFFHLLPKPDLVVALHGRPELLFERKGEFPAPVLAEMQKKLDMALTYLQLHGIQLIRIDTTQHDLSSETAMVQQRVWQSLTGKGEE